MPEELLAGGVAANPLGRDVPVGLALHQLPTSIPEPRLLGGDRQLRVQLDHTVLTLDDAQLGAWLIEPVALAHISRECEHAAALQRDVVTLPSGGA